MKQLLLVLPAGEEVGALTPLRLTLSGCEAGIVSNHLAHGKPEGKAIRVEASTEGLNGFLWIH